jgi:hypothetical protein
MNLNACIMNMEIDKIPSQQANPWQTFVNSLSEFTTDFMETRDEPSQPDRESFD